MAYAAILILSAAIIYQAHGQTCSWNFTQPSNVTVDYLIESGESAYFNVLVISEVLTNADRVTWKYNGTDIALLRYSSTGEFVELLSNPRGLASSERNNHSLIIPAINETDDGAQISVISGGCTVNDVSPTITLRVISTSTTIAPSTATNVISTETTLVTESGIATTATTAAAVITTAEISTIDVTSTSSVVSTTDNIASTNSSSVTDTGGFLTTRETLAVTDTAQSENISSYESTIAINQSAVTNATQDANGNENAIDDRPWWFVLAIVLPIFVLLLASVGAVAVARYYKCCCFGTTSKVSDSGTADHEHTRGASIANQTH